MLPLIGQADGKKVRTYISVKDAWKLYGYKVQYLRRLLRQKKLSRRKIGQVWLIEVSSLENYLFSSNQSKDRRCGPRTKPKLRPRS
jgi:phage antirepressor YoqD-like protein